MRRMIGLWSLVLAATLLATGCLQSDASPDLAERSTADVLVPTDRRFLDSWTFAVDDSADNYTFRSNWSPSFDPSIDPDLLVVGYQINDPATWSGGSETGAGEADRAAVVAAVTDATTPGPEGPCTAVDPSIDLVACSYDTGGPDGPLRLTARSFPATGSVVIVITDNEAAADYLSGQFSVTSFGDAAASWMDE